MTTRNARIVALAERLSMDAWLTLPWAIEIPIVQAYAPGRQVGPVVVRDPTRCRRGLHAMDRGNIYVQPGTGARVCRACRVLNLARKRKSRG